MEVALLPPRVSRVWQSGRILCAQNPQRQLPVLIVRELHPPSRGSRPIGSILHRPLRCHRQALDPQLQLLINQVECQLGGSRTTSSFWGGHDVLTWKLHHFLHCKQAHNNYLRSLSWFPTSTTRQRSWVPARRLPCHVTVLRGSRRADLEAPSLPPL